MKLVSRRRAMIYLGAAILAASSGAGFAVWRRGERQLSAQTMQQLWATELQTPDGQGLALSNFQGRPLVLNFWATWCPPCIEEMPLIDLFYRKNKAKNWQIVGIAVDQPSRVRDFLKRSPVSYAIALGGFQAAQIGKMLGNEAGSLPFTVVFNADGELIYQKLGRLSASDMEKWVH